jgi:hypothetical protein
VTARELGFLACRVLGLAWLASGVAGAIDAWFAEPLPPGVPPDFARWASTSAWLGRLLIGVGLWLSARTLVPFFGPRGAESEDRRANAPAVSELLQVAIAVLGLCWVAASVPELAVNLVWTSRHALEGQSAALARLGLTALLGVALFLGAGHIVRFAGRSRRRG